MNGGLFTVDELAVELCVHISTVRRWLVGVTPYAMMGRRPLYTLAQVAEARRL